VAWLEGHVRSEPERPFLLFLHVFDIHSPYEPPEPFDRRFDPDYDGPLERISVDDPDSIVRPGIDPASMQRVWDLYDGEIAWVDSQIARLLERLEQLGHADDTLVVLTSDHGEEFLEHGQSGHRKELFVESLHVPLILRLPGRIPAGARVDVPVSILDLAPTVYALLDVPPPPGLPGIDLAALARGELAAPERTLVGELTEVTETFADRALSLYSADEHVIVYQLGLPEQRVLRYDLRENPLEEGPPEPVPEGSEAWRAVQARIDDLRARLRALRASARPREGAMAIDELDRSELEALGYAGSTQEAGEDHGRLCLDGCVWGDP
jgi:arylsulfatase A-like enzyme